MMQTILHIICNLVGCLGDQSLYASIQAVL